MCIINNNYNKGLNIFDLKHKCNNNKLETF